MADNERPQGRKRTSSGQGKDIKTQNQGLGTGPVGRKDGYAGRKQQNTARPGSTSSGQGPDRDTSGLTTGLVSGLLGSLTRGKGSFLSIIIILVILYLGGQSSGLFGNLFGGGGNETDQGTNIPPVTSQAASTPVVSNSSKPQSVSSQSTATYVPGNALSYFTGNATTSTGWTTTTNTSSAPVTTVVSGARAKRTNIVGGGRDTVTIMIYMCGTDLESRNGMATSDLTEIAQAKYGDNVRVIVYTGGCAGWKINGISNSVHQIYQVKNGQLIRLEDSFSKGSMTDPTHLAEFIQYAAKNFEANRYELILWDHGGGSVTGYGYDENYKNTGSMSLASVSSALKAGGVTFDFVGFDACLMATLETALMLDNYADYLIASEETEPGIGWYYTDWLTALGSNTSLPTVQLGQKIVDSFVEQCNSKCRGQKTTLSVVDLAELAYTVPSELSAFARNISSKIQAKDYQVVSNARYQTREFGSGSGIDQVDLVHLAKNMGTSEGTALANAILGAVKYNRTSSSMTNAYGLSIYFPYQSTKYVDTAVKTYNAIGMNDDYSDCIRAFANLQVCGQVASGGTSNPLEALLGGYSGGSSGSMDMIGSLLSSFLTGRSHVIEGLDETNTEFLDADSVSKYAEYLATNYLDASQLTWNRVEGADGNTYDLLTLSEEQWKLVHSLYINMFYDDGTRYLDLGMDDAGYTFDQFGNLLPEDENLWFTIEGEFAALYIEDTYDDGSRFVTTARVPVLLNGEYADLIVVFDDEHPDGYVAGARQVYKENETETVAKAMTELAEGDEIVLVYDAYTYDGTFIDSYPNTVTITVEGDLETAFLTVPEGKAVISYCLTDLYNREYWTESLER